uniref:Uncharacterized protein n=1 Tax=Anguilla anguilla TaxID=7936 RepID=A0A0E9W1W8_ANGAN
MHTAKLDLDKVQVKEITMIIATLPLLKSILPPSTLGLPTVGLLLV